MLPDTKSLLLPVFLIALGTGWLLSVLGVIPDINWPWTLGLAIIGVMTLVAGGFDKFTVVVGPFFLAASGLSVLRQTGRLTVDLEIPILVIALGVLMFVAQFPVIPTPAWVIPRSERRDPTAAG